MSVYCRLGSCLWSWEPWTVLDPITRLLWIGLYTTAEAKRLPPGLFQGSVYAMADATRLPSDDVLRGLDQLIEHDLVEYDTKLRVARLVTLPDPGESPASGNVIRGWFTKFKSLPACLVRDAHVTTLRWILDEWSRENGKPISADHAKAWSETFGDPAKVRIPPPRKRGVRKLDEVTQRSLFDTVPEPLRPLDEVRSVDISDSLHQPNEIRDSETTSNTFAKVLDQDQDRDQDQDLLSVPEGAEIRASGSTGDGEIAISPRPTLRLVPLPPPLPITVDQLLGILNTRGLVAQEAERRALGDAIVTLGEPQPGEDLLALLRDWARPGSPLMVGEAIGQLREWLARARENLRVSNAKREALKAAREGLGL